MDLIDPRHYCMAEQPPNSSEYYADWHIDCVGEGGVHLNSIMLNLSRPHSLCANTVGFGIFPPFCELFVQCAKISSLWGGMGTFFEICEKRPFQKCMGWGGGGGRWSHFSANRASNWTMHRTEQCSRDH